MSFAVADAIRLPLADRSVDLVFGSPLYCDARTYGIGAQRDCRSWVAWMLDVTAEAQRVSRGPVVWVAAGVTRKRNYWPACEGLMWEWWQRGGECQLYRPCVFHRVGVPGSGGKDWFRADWEYVMCFKRPGALPWSDNTACGHPPKRAPGGEMSNRTASGSRVNQWGHSIDSGATVTGAGGMVRSKGRRPSHRLSAKRDKWGCTPGSTNVREPDGTRCTRKVHFSHDANGSTKGGHGQDIVAIANPGNVIKCNVGGGLMGHKLAHENEAPFPEKLAAFFVRSLCPPGGLVLDPFSGSGTTVAVATKYGRRGLGLDLRESQARLGRQRCAEVQMELIA
jgi:hypothetical protein